MFPTKQRACTRKRIDAANQNSSVKKLERVYQNGGTLCSAAVVLAFFALFCSFFAEPEWRVECIMCKKRYIVCLRYLALICMPFVKTKLVFGQLHMRVDSSL